MKKLNQLVTIFVTAMFLLSCSSDENIGFEAEPVFTKTIGKVEADRATVVLAVDDSASMISKVNELSSDLKSMFFDLISAGWEIDLHVVTCAFHKNGAQMKSASTSSINNKKAYTQKVDLLMKEASPTIDLSTITNDADERCNQSLEKAWSQIAFKNKVNISMLISNEDGCARSESNVTLPDVAEGTTRNNCAPVTFGRMTRSYGIKLLDEGIDQWEKVVSDYLGSWIPWYNKTLSKNLYPVQYYVDFFTDLEKRGKQSVPNFSHIYLPIVVDTKRCLAESLMNQALAEREKKGANFVRPQNTVGNIGYYYLETFNGLKQENILFDQNEGDLSLCDDLSHVVSKVQREIKLRGQSVKHILSRPIDVETMKRVSPNKPILRVIRNKNLVSSENFFVEKNKELAQVNLAWKKINDSQYALDLFLGSPMVEYNPNEPSLLILNSKFLTVTSGDEVMRLDFTPLGFRERENELIFNGE